MGWEFVRHDDTPLDGALLLVGMPSVGLVGPVAAGLLVDHLGMRVVGALQSPDLPPASVVRRGIVTSPVQVWASDQACGPDGACDRLLVLKSDLPLPAETLWGLADEVARWAKEERIGLVVGLEGYPAQGKGAPKGVLLASSLKGAKAAEGLGIPPLEEAMLTGFNAVLLMRANKHGVPAVGLFAPVPGKETPAVALLHRVDPLLPRLDLADAALAKRAEALEARLTTEVAQHADAERAMRDNVDRSYA